MQANISCALITAFERQYDTSWDDPKLRNERLAMRYGWTAAMEAKQCLHQIQEPAAAVAVPDGWKLVPIAPTEAMLLAIMSEGEKDAARQLDPKLLGELMERAGMQQRYANVLASAAAPAATPADAPVVLPEPAGATIEKLLALARIVDIAVEDWGESLADGSMDVKFHSDVVTELESILDHFDGLPEGPDDNVIESGPVKAARILRALLATATGLPAQAVARIVHLRADRKQRIYVAGPMTGLPEFNFPAFNSAADKLRAEGWHVENPAEHGHIDGADWADYLRWDISRIATCGAIYLLPGWEGSKGATLEVSIGKALGMEFILAPDAAPQAQADARDADGEAFRTAARLGLTLRFYGNCAQSGAPGTPSVYEVTTGPDSAEAMRASIDRAAIAAAKGE